MTVSLTVIKKWLLPTFIALSVVVIVFILFFIFPSQSVKEPPVLPTPTPNAQTTGPPIPARGEQYEKSLREIETRENEQLRRDTLIGNLLNSLPYEGKHLLLSYNISTNRFVATMKKDDEANANDELDVFLRSNGIEDRSWIKNLVVVFE